MMRELERLQGTMEALTKKINAAEESVQAYADRYVEAQEEYQRETQEFEEAESESFSNFLRSVVGRQEQRIEKEREEMIQARVERDVAERELAGAEAHLGHLTKKLDEVKQEIEEVREELLNEDAVFSEKVQEEKAKRIEWQQTFVEVDEAVRAGKAVLRNINRAIDELNSADGWATWDMFGGGLVSDLIKYDKIDEAEELMVDVEISVERYQSELKDISPQFRPVFTFVSSSHRAIDIFFDNIFIDISTKKRIQENIEELYAFKKEVKELQEELFEQGMELKEKIERSEQLYGKDE